MLKISVKDTNGEPLVGAQIKFENSKDYFYTDFDGNVIINKTQIQTTAFSVSMIAYENKTVELSKSSSDLDIKLKSK